MGNSTNVTSSSTIQAWKSGFDDEYGKQKNTWESYSTSRDSKKFYQLGYCIDGLNAMYEAFRQNSYLDEVVRFVKNVTNSAAPAPQFGDGFRGWACLSVERERGKEIPLYESCMWRYVTRTLRIIKETPGLFNNPSYREFFDSILAFTERDIWEKWFGRGNNQKFIYRSRTHMSCHWAFIALNLFKLSSDHLKKRQYQGVFTNINNKLRNNMRPAVNNPAAYFWNATWDDEETRNPQVQDVSHANHVLAYIVECVEHAISWDRADMDRFSNTLKDIVWEPQVCEFSDFVDGARGGVDNVKRPGRRQSDGWVKLGAYNSEIQDIHVDFINRNPEGARHGKQLPQLYANLALNEQKRDAGKPIRLTWPRGGERLQMNSKHEITWLDKESAENKKVNIEFSADNGNSWEVIAASTDNDGLRRWKVPAKPSDNCLIRISRIDGSAADVTGEKFSIVRS